MRAPSTRHSVLIDELLHAGPAVLISHYLAREDDAVRHCFAPRVTPLRLYLLGERVKGLQPFRQETMRPSLGFD